MWINISKWVKCEDICVPRECHQGVSSAEEDFNNQVSRATHSVNSISLFTQTPLPSPNGPMDKMAMVAVMEVSHGLSNVDFCSQGQPSNGHF